MTPTPTFADLCWEHHDEIHTDTVVLGSFVLSAGPCQTSIDSTIAPKVGDPWIATMCVQDLEDQYEAEFARKEFEFQSPEHARQQAIALFVSELQKAAPQGAAHWYARGAQAERQDILQVLRAVVPDIPSTLVAAIQAIERREPQRKLPLFEHDNCHAYTRGPAPAVQRDCGGDGHYMCKSCARHALDNVD